MKTIAVAALAALTLAACVSEEERRKIAADRSVVQRQVLADYVTNVKNAVDFCIQQVETGNADPNSLLEIGFKRGSAAIINDSYEMNWTWGRATARVILGTRADGCTFRLPKGYVSQTSHRSYVTAALKDRGFDVGKSSGQEGTGAQAVISTLFLGAPITSSDIQDATRGDTTIELSSTVYQGPYFDEIFIRKPTPQDTPNEDK